MALPIEEVRRLASLARLNLTDDEAQKAGEDLEKILSYVDRLAKVDTKGVPEQEGEQEVETRQDVVRPSGTMTHDLILENFPEKVGDALKVPAVFDKPKG